jgi:hypothetical protein
VPGSQSSDPAIALDPQNHDVFLAWLAGDSASNRLWFSRSTDGGHSWLTPIAVSPPGEPLGERVDAMPRLTCDSQGRLAILWAIGSAHGAERDSSELRFVRSLDHGATWSEATTIHDVPGMPRSRGFHDLVATEDGRLYAAWLVPPASGDTSHFAAGDGATIHVALSRDFGAHWGESSPEWAKVCPCCGVTLSPDLIGTIYATFRLHYEDGACDVGLARVFGPPICVYHDGWKVEDCPHSAPGFEVARDGTLRVAWFTGAPGQVGVWYRQSTPERYDSTSTPLRLLASRSPTPLHLAVGDAGRSGTLVACDGDSVAQGSLTLFRIEGSGRRVAERVPVTGVRECVDPQLAASNRSRSAFVAWTERRGREQQLRLLRWSVGR